MAKTAHSTWESLEYGMAKLLLIEVQHQWFPFSTINRIFQMAAPHMRREAYFEPGPALFARHEVDVKLDKLQGEAGEIELPASRLHHRRGRFIWPHIPKATSLATLPLLWEMGTISRLNAWQLLKSSSEVKWLLISSKSNSTHSMMMISLLQEVKSKGFFHILSSIQVFRQTQRFEGNLFLNAKAILGKPLHTSVIGGQVDQSQDRSIAIDFRFAEEPGNHWIGKLVSSQVLSTFLHVRKAPPDKAGRGMILFPLLIHGMVEIVLPTSNPKCK